MSDKDKARELYLAAAKVCGGGDLGIFESPIIAAFNAGYAAALEGRRWIPCSERLPEFGVEVLGFFAFEDFTAIERTERLKHSYCHPWGWRFSDVQKESDLVTHWQPLPEPPSLELEKKAGE